MPSKIIFKITPQGMTFEGDGFVGGKCLTELEKFKAFAEAHGIKIDITSQIKKPELYATPENNQNKW
jgi:hypothetical protein